MISTCKYALYKWVNYLFKFRLLQLLINLTAKYLIPVEKQTNTVKCYWICLRLVSNKVTDLFCIHSRYLLTSVKLTFKHTGAEHRSSPPLMLSGLTRTLSKPMARMSSKGTLFVVKDLKTLLLWRTSSLTSFLQTLTNGNSLFKL